MTHGPEYLSPRPDERPVEVGKQDDHHDDDAEKGEAEHERREPRTSFCSGGKSICLSAMSNGLLSA